MFFVKMLNSETVVELGTHRKTISRIPEQMYYPSDTGLGMAWGGSLFTLVSNKHCGAKMRILFKSFSRPLLKSSMGPLARYSNHQEIVNRRPEQMYTSFDTRLEWHRERSLFELHLNKRPKTGPLFESAPRSLLKSGLLPVDRCGTCQETISRRLEHMYTPWLREGPIKAIWDLNWCICHLT